MLTILGVNLGMNVLVGARILGKECRKIRGKKSPSTFAEKFAGNFPKICQARIKKFTPVPLCRTSGSKKLPAILRDVTTFCTWFFPLFPPPHPPPPRPSPTPLVARCREHLHVEEDLHPAGRCPDPRVYPLARSY